jgi:hypothetical protein
MCIYMINTILNITIDYNIKSSSLLQSIPWNQPLVIFKIPKIINHRDFNRSVL